MKTETFEQLIQDWIGVGYTKPTARSMAILDKAIEKAQGYPGRGLFPWSVKLTGKATHRLGMDNPFICTATELHEAAGKWQKL